MHGTRDPLRDPRVGRGGRAGEPGATTITLPNGVVIPALDGQAGALLGADPWVVGPTCVGPSVPLHSPLPHTPVQAANELDALPA